jgi:hypothetical protein
MTITVKAGFRYRSKSNEIWTCIYVEEDLAWCKIGKDHTAYVFKINGETVSLASNPDYYNLVEELPEMREYLYRLEDPNNSWVEAYFSATAERTDYGVARSPVWWEIDPNSIHMDSILIFDTSFSWGELKRTFGANTATQMFNDLVQHVPDDINEWELSE